MKTKKRLFVGLLGTSLLFVTGLILLSWYMIAHRESLLDRWFLGLLGSAVAVLIMVVGFGIAGLVLTLWLARSFPSLQNLMLMATNLLFPIALSIGRVLKVPPESVKGSFIEVNNQLVRARGISARPEQVLILAPHCLQRSQCKYKVTIQAANCKRCGACPIDELHKIAERYGVHLLVATGGTIARKFVEQIHPRAIVAIACENDLTSGIQDINPLPVMGVLNVRPNGPCYNTGVSLGAVEDAVRYFLRGEFLGNSTGQRL